MIFYHFSQFKNFKIYYQTEVIGGKLFKNSVCYARFIQIIPSFFIPLIMMLHYLSGKKTGVYFVDYSHLAVCKNIRITRNKTFKGSARGHSSIGCFYGFKLHMIINKSEIIAIKITPGNRDAPTAFEEIALKNNLKGTCY